MVSSQLRKRTAGKHISSTIAGICNICRRARNQRANNRSAHAAQFLIGLRQIIHTDICRVNCRHQHIFNRFTAHRRAVRSRNLLGDDFDGRSRCDVAAGCAAHAVANHRPGNTVRQFPCRIRVLVVFARLADIGFCYNFQVRSPSFRFEARSWPQEALISLPSVRRTVTVYPFCSRIAENRFKRSSLLFL